MLLVSCVPQPLGAGDFPRHIPRVTWNGQYIVRNRRLGATGTAFTTVLFLQSRPKRTWRSCLRKITVPCPDLFLVRNRSAIQCPREVGVQAGRRLPRCPFDFLKLYHSFSTAYPKSDLDWTIYRAKQRPWLFISFSSYS